MRVLAVRPRGGGLAWSCLALAIVGASGSARAATCPGGALRIEVGQSIQAMVDAAPENAQFCIASGVHRLESVTPRNGQGFHGETGAVLNGARVVTTFTREEQHWVATGQHQAGLRRAGESCLADRPRCSRPDAVFLDDLPLHHVERPEDVGPGRFHLDDLAGRLLLGDDPVGRVVEAAVAPFAFAGPATGIQIRGLVIEKYAAPIQHAAIGGGVKPVGWHVEGNEVRLNHGVGIQVGSFSQVIRNLVSDNGQMGVGASGRDIRFERNEIRRNGFWSGIDVYWEGGGSKFSETQGLVLDGNFVRDNHGYGLWSDIDNIDTLYEGNRVERNSGSGINHEISYRAVIRGNTLIGNGFGFHAWLWGAGIQIQNSQDVEVTGNHVDMTDGGNGIVLIQQDRGVGAFGPWVTRGNFVHGNTLASRRRDHGASGAIADHDQAGMRAGGNRFDRNRYDVVRADDDQWAWIDGFYAWDAYRQRSGQDQNSEVRASEAPASRPWWRFSQ